MSDAKESGRTLLKGTPTVAAGTKKLWVVVWYDLKQNGSEHTRINLQFTGTEMPE